MPLALALAGCMGESGGSGGVGNSGADGSVVAASTASLQTEKTLPPEQRPARADAARFVAQASFGATGPDEIETIRAIGFDAWLAHQQSVEPWTHLGWVNARARETEDGRPTEAMVWQSIWQQWLFAQDQLRARIAFALSQIFVISDIAPDLDPRAMAAYLDVLNRNAFGNYRRLLEEVTLHPAMGYYLNMLQSEKEDPASGRLPNENYAREVLQLFSIGLVRLNRDGSVQRDGSGKPIPTYDQAVVRGFAKAFSGWSFGGRDTAASGSFHDGDGDWTLPMQPWPAKHSGATKLLLDGRTLPAGQDARKDMADALDAIFAHPNVGPFIGRRLIQRLVTANPSPAYIGRVAAAFDDNGAGVRGDLAAVVRAVLLDPETRDATLTTAAGAGKQREPVIRFANLLRALGAASADGRNPVRELDDGENALGQSPLLAPSVFNFFSPDFRPPGPIAQAGLVAPEFQITTETTVVGTLNFFARLIDAGGYGWDTSRLDLNLAPLESLAGDPQALVDRLSLLLMNDAISDATRATMVKAITAIRPTRRTERVKAALLLAAIAPDFVIQR